MHTAKELLDVMEFYASLGGSDLDYRRPEPQPGEEIVVFEPFVHPGTGEILYRLRQ